MNHQSQPFDASSADTRESGRIRILLVEDQPGDVMLVREALEQYEVAHELEVSTDSRKVLPLIEQWRTRDAKPPDVLILDMDLHNNSAERVHTALREHPVTRTIPVILLISWGEIAEVHSGDASRMVRAFKKAFDLDEFMELGKLVREVWNAARLQA